MTNLFRRVLMVGPDRSGATAIEYGLIAALVSVALIAGATSMGSRVGLTFNKVAAKIATP